MFSRNSFGSYYPIDSIIHRLNPIIKIIYLVLIFVICFISNSLFINSITFLLIFLMLLLSYVPFNYYFNTFYSLRYVYIFLAFVCFYFDKDLVYYVILLFKIVNVILYVNMLSYTTSPSESAYGIEKFLSFFNILCLPISKISFKLNSLLRYHALSLNVRFKTFKAISSRGIDYFKVNIIGRFYTFLRVRKNIRRLKKIRNREVKFSQELRLFNLKKYRTNYKSNKAGFYDMFFLLFFVIIIVLHFKERGVI